MDYTALAAWAAVGCALLVVWLQNRKAKQLACLQLFVQISAQYDSADMQQVRAELAAQLLADPKALDISDCLLVFYENVAILHRRELLDKELVRNTFSIDVVSYWKALKHYVDDSRKTWGKEFGPDFYSEFERLAKVFLEETEGRPISDAAKIDFLKSEVKRGFRNLPGSTLSTPKLLTDKAEN